MTVSNVARAYLICEDTLLVGVAVCALLIASPHPLAALALVLLVKGTFLACGLYDFRAMPTRSVFWGRLFVGAAISTVCALVLFGWGLAGAIFLLGFFPAIVLARSALEVVTKMRRFRRRVLVLGLGDRANRTAREMIDQRSRDYEVVGFLAGNENERGWRIGNCPVLGLVPELEAVVRAHRIDRVVVALADRRGGMPLDALLRVRLAGVEVVEEPRVHEEIAGKIPVEDLRPSWLIFSDGFSRGAFRRFTKRTFDILVATTGLLLGAPLMLAAAAAVRLTSKGPVLFRQVRLGEGGQEFTLLKFRTMCVDAEQSGTPQWAQANDPRVTPVGRFFRKSRIDEMPQMWNVLQGAMSFVGPRPERPFFVEQLRDRIPFYDQRHAVKPGITGWAQVRFRYGSDEADQVEKLRYDMYYVKHQSLRFDMRILFDTVRVVFQKNMGR